MADYQSRTKAGISFVHGFTVNMAIIPIGYGILTFVFGAEMWSGATYGSAMSVPYAPQSWGTVALALGILIVISERKRLYGLMSVACFLSATWCLIFAFFFLFDCIRHGMSFGAPGVLVYSTIGVAFLSLSRLAWKWR